MPTQTLLRQLLGWDGRGHKLAACPVGLIDFCGSRETALFLWQLLYWAPNGERRIVKTGADFFEAARLTSHNLRTAAAWLSDNGYGCATATTTPTGRANAYELNRPELEAALRAFCRPGGSEKVNDPKRKQRSPKPAPEPGGDSENLNDGGTQKVNDPEPMPEPKRIDEILTIPPPEGSANVDEGVVETLTTSPNSSSIGGRVLPNVVELEREARVPVDDRQPEQAPEPEAEDEAGGSFNFALPPTAAEFPDVPAGLLTWGAALKCPFKSEPFIRAWLWRRVILWKFHATTFGGGMREQLAIKDMIAEAGAGSDEGTVVRLIEYANRKGWKHVYQRKQDNANGKRNTPKVARVKHPDNAGNDFGQF